MTIREDVLLAGDVNIHMDEDDLYSNQFKDILNTSTACRFPYTHSRSHVGYNRNIWSYSNDIKYQV